MGAEFSFAASPTEFKRPDRMQAMVATTHEAHDRLERAARNFLPSLLECNAAVVRVALVEAGFAFACARKLSTATSAWQFEEVLIGHVRQHYDAMSETAAQLSTLLEIGSWEDDENMSLTFWD